VTFLLAVCGHLGCRLSFCAQILPFYGSVFNPYALNMYNRDLEQLIYQMLSR